MLGLYAKKTKRHSDVTNAIADIIVINIKPVNAVKNQT